MTPRLTRVGACLLLVVSCWLLLAPQQLGGGLTYVTTNGSSMAPQFQTGDLAVLRPARRYAVGDVAAYRSRLLDTVVMHRVVAVDQETYSLRGDGNGWLDPETVTRDQMVGKLLLRVPHGGAWLDRLTSPAALGLVTFLLVATGSTAVRGRRTSRNRRTDTMGSTPRRSPGASAPTLLTATAATVTAAVAGIALGAAAWAAPAPGAPGRDADRPQSMTFAYDTVVPRSPAYDDTTVTSPEPVFRRLADTVQVHLVYRGEPGTIAVDAELSSPNGWSSTVALAPVATFTAETYDATVTLDLDALERRGLAAAEAIGSPSEEVGIRVVPTVRTRDGGVFTPALPLTLTPLKLALTGDPDALTVTDAAPAPEEPLDGLDVPVLGWTLPTPVARTFSAVLVLAAVLAAGALALLARRSAATEADAILRRYARLLAPVHPMPTPAGRPVVDVTDFPTLARLAERYGLLVLHWSRSDVTTFVVQDEGATYRYRTGVPAASEELTTA